MLQKKKLRLRKHRVSLKIEPSSVWIEAHNRRSGSWFLILCNSYLCSGSTRLSPGSGSKTRPVNRSVKRPGNFLVTSGRGCVHPGSWRREHCTQPHCKLCSIFSCHCSESDWVAGCQRSSQGEPTGETWFLASRCQGNGMCNGEIQRLGTVNQVSVKYHLNTSFENNCFTAHISRYFLNKISCK